MSKNFLRKCTLSLSGSSSLSIPGGGPKDLRIEAAIGASTLQSPDPARFRITNPNPQTIAAFKNKEFSTVTFEAGYVDNCGVIYKGDVRQSIYAHSENVVDSYIDVFSATDGNAYQQATVEKTLAAGWTPKDKAMVAIDAMKPFGITGLGLVNVDLDNPKYPRGRPFIGQARDLLRQVSLSAGAVWWMNGDGKVNIVDHTKPLESGGAIVLNSKTGQIGFAAQTEGGVVVRCLINPAIKVGTSVKIDERSIVEAEKDNSYLGEASSRNIDLAQTGRIAADGIYRVVFMEVECDSRGGPWYQILTCIATGAPLNAGQSATYAGPPLDIGLY